MGLTGLMDAYRAATQPPVPEGHLLIDDRSVNVHEIEKAHEWYIEHVLKLPKPR